MGCVLWYVFFIFKHFNAKYITVIKKIKFVSEFSLFSDMFIPVKNFVHALSVIHVLSNIDCVRSSYHCVSIERIKLNLKCLWLWCDVMWYVMWGDVMWCVV